MTTDTPPTALTARHLVVLTAIATGHTAAAIERRLGISGRTIRRITTEACDILGARNSVHAVALAVLGGHIDPEHLTGRTIPEHHPDRVRPWG